MSDLLFPFKKKAEKRGQAQPSLIIATWLNQWGCSINWVEVHELSWLVIILFLKNCPEIKITLEIYWIPSIFWWNVCHQFIYFLWEANFIVLNSLPIYFLQRHIYGHQGKNIQIFADNSNLAVNPSYVRSWLDVLSQTPRVAPFFSKSDPFVMALKKVLLHYFCFCLSWILLLFQVKGLPTIRWFWLWISQGNLCSLGSTNTRDTYYMIQMWQI